jgi:hypothetical protein
MSEHETHGPVDERTHIWDDPKNVQRFLYAFYACLVILVVLDFVIHRHIYHPWERIPAFHALYGFGACWILVVIAKQMRRVLMRDEDYYDGA